jgi:predicted dehydrogenase
MTAGGPSFNVLIAGAGSIGAFHDDPSSRHSLTHAHAYARHPAFNLVGFTDLDGTRALEATRIWGGRTFDTVEAAFERERIDVVSVCTPDDTHHDVLMRLSRLPVRLIFAEKPLANSPAEADEIVAALSLSRIPVCVNFKRRFIPEYGRLRAEIQGGACGEFLAGVGYYGKGARHSGSHMIDILRFFLGEVQAARVTHVVDDGVRDDPSAGAVLSLAGGGTVLLQPVDCRQFTMFELDLLFARRRIRLTDLGARIEESEVIDDDVFKGYRVIRRSRESEAALGDALYFAVENIAAYLTHGVPLAATLHDGHRAVAIADLLH